jgi:hypothetical protein
MDHYNSSRNFFDDLLKNPAEQRRKMLKDLVPPKIDPIETHRQMLKGIANPIIDPVKNHRDSFKEIIGASKALSDQVKIYPDKLINESPLIDPSTRKLLESPILDIRAKLAVDSLIDSVKNHKDPLKEVIGASKALSDRVKIYPDKLINESPLIDSSTKKLLESSNWQKNNNFIEPRLIEPGINISKFVEPRLIEPGINSSISDKLITRTDKIIRDQAKFSEINKLTQQLSTFERLSSANSSVKQFIESLDDKKISKLLEQQEYFGAKKYSINPTFENSPIYSSVLRSRLDDILRLSTLSERSLSRLSSEHIGNAIELTATGRNSIRHNLKRLANSYSKLFESFKTEPSYLFSLPPTLLKYSSVEFFNEVNIIESITTDADFDIYLEHEEETTQSKENIKKETENTIEQLLRDLNPELITPLDGARYALLESNNPDRVRHFIVSLRELFTHVLHQLAPNNKIKNWSTSPQDYDKEGKPTRRARLLYICRDINYKPFSDFLKKHMDAVLEFINLFQRGTHEVIPKYTDLQLRMMLLRMESALRFLLEVSKTTVI